MGILQRIRGNLLLAQGTGEHMREPHVEKLLRCNQRNFRATLYYPGYYPSDDEPAHKVHLGYGDRFQAEALLKSISERINESGYAVKESDNFQTLTKRRAKFLNPALKIEFHGRYAVARHRKRDMPFQDLRSLMSSPHVEPDEFYVELDYHSQAIEPGWRRHWGQWHSETSNGFRLLTERGYRSYRWEAVRAIGLIDKAISGIYAEHVLHMTGAETVHRSRPFSVTLLSSKVSARTKAASVA